MTCNLCINSCFVMLKRINRYCLSSTNKHSALKRSLQVTTPCIRVDVLIIGGSDSYNWLACSQRKQANTVRRRSNAPQRLQKYINSADVALIKHNFGAAARCSQGRRKGLTNRAPLPSISHSATVLVPFKLDHCYQPHCPSSSSYHHCHCHCWNQNQSHLSACPCRYQH